MNKTKTIVALHLMAIVVAAGVAMLAEDQVFAQPANPNTTNTQAVDQPDSQSQTSNVDNHSDSETNDDHNSANEGPNGDGDGELPDQTESGQ